MALNNKKSGFGFDMEERLKRASARTEAHTADATGDLPDLRETPATPEAVVAQEAEISAPKQEEKTAPADRPLGTPLSIYGEKKKAENKSFKMNVLLKPSLVAKMDRAKLDGEIKSRNDLIVDLLEQHFALDEAVKSGRFTTREELAEYLLEHYCPWAR